jgi:hypothetical protein
LRSAGSGVRTGVRLTSRGRLKQRGWIGTKGCLKRRPELVSNPALVQLKIKINASVNEPQTIADLETKVGKQLSRADKLSLLEESSRYIITSWRPRRLSLLSRQAD